MHMLFSTITSAISETSRAQLPLGRDEHSDLAWEIIVVDDNSLDSTQDVAAELTHMYGEDEIVSYPCPCPTPATCAQRTLHIPAGPAPVRWQTWPRVCADALIVSLLNARPDVA